MRKHGGGFAVTWFLLILMVAGCASVTPAQVNDSKKAVVAADSAWKVVRESAINAYLDGKVTDQQIERFRVLDRKVVASGRLLRDAVKALDAGQTKDPARVTLLTSQLFGLLLEGAKLAAELGVPIGDLAKAIDAGKAGAK
jgi:hypothetical protein